MTSGTSQHRTAAAPLPSPQSSQGESLIDDQLLKTRRQVQGVEITAGLLGLGIGTVAYLFALALADHWLVAGGLGFGARLAAILALAFAAGVWGYFRVLRPLLRRINPVFVAHRIEASRPSLKNSLVNFLLLRGESRGLSSGVYRALEDRAADDLAGVSPEGVVDRRHVVRLATVFVLLVLIGGIYHAASPKSPLTSAVRIAWPWTETAAPTRVTIADVKPGNATAFYGDTIAVSAEVSGVAAGEPVMLLFDTADGQSVDEAIPMQLPEGGYRYVCQLPPGKHGLQQNLQYRLSAGDCSTNRYTVTVQTPPMIEVERIDYRYPRYTQIPDRTTVRQGDIRGIEGSEITIHATANVPIGDAEIDLNCDSLQGLKMNVKGNKAVGRFKLRMSGDDATQPQHDCYQLRFKDSQGRENPRPTRYDIDVIADRPPRVRIENPPAEHVQLPENSALRLAVEAEDADFALSKVTVRGECDGRSLPIRAMLNRLSDEPPHTGAFKGIYVFEPAALGLVAGDRVVYWAEATDNKSPLPNVADTQRFWVTVVEATHENQQQKQDNNAADDSQRGDNQSENNGQGNQQQQQGQAGADQQDKQQRGDQQQGAGQQGAGQQTDHQQGAEQTEQQGGGQKGEGAAQQGRGPQDEQPQAAQQQGDKQQADKPVTEQQGQARQDDRQPDAGQQGEQQEGQGQKQQGRQNVQQRQNEQQDQARQDDEQQPSQDRQGEPQQSQSQQDVDRPSQPIDGETNPGDVFERALKHINQQQEARKAEQSETRSGDQRGDKQPTEKQQDQQAAADRQTGQSEEDKDQQSQPEQQLGHQQQDKQPSEEETQQRGKAERSAQQREKQQDQQGRSDQQPVAGDKQHPDQSEQQRGTAEQQNNKAEDAKAGADQKAGQQGNDRQDAQAKNARDEADQQKSAPRPDTQQKGAQQQGARAKADQQQDTRNKEAQEQDTPEPDAQEKDGRAADAAPSGRGASDQLSAERHPPEIERPTTPGEDFNKQYADKATDLVLEEFQKQLAKNRPDRELLDSLGGWTRRDLKRFTERWLEMKRAARQAGAPGARQKLDETLRSLGLSPTSTDIRGGTPDDDLQRLREQRRIAPPPKWAPLIRAYKQSVDARPGAEPNSDASRPR